MSVCVGGGGGGIMFGARSSSLSWLNRTNGILRFCKDSANKLTFKGTSLLKSSEEKI